MIPEFKNKTMAKILFNLFILAIVLILFRIFTEKAYTKEGFTQIEKFVLKKDAQSYDDFYAQIYDSIHLPKSKTEVAEILKITGADKHSTFLDVGSGTGSTVNALTESGAKCIGIDKSDAMIAVAKEKYGNSVHIQKGDATEPILFVRNQFSHILCLNQTIYEMSDKHAFFTNCRYWLKNGGVLAIHLVDKHKFNTVVPAGQPMFIDNPQKYVESRITKTEVDFNDFTYLAKYDIKSKEPSLFTETFTDATTKNIRQNERVLYMDSEEDVLKIASRCGFSQLGKINMHPINSDEHQHIYILT
jgi:ubiquinone/menaquinone biosynthesis C-methylase UbiE